MDIYTRWTFVKNGFGLYWDQNQLNNKEVSLTHISHEANDIKWDIVLNIVHYRQTDLRQQNFSSYYTSKECFHMKTRKVRLDSWRYILILNSLEYHCQYTQIIQQCWLV